MRSFMLLSISFMLLISGRSSVESLSLSGSAKRTKPIRRVAIVGAGIAGLSLAHALKNSPSLEVQYGDQGLEVSIFDSRKRLDYQAGAGVQLNGGMAVLGKINPEIQEAVIEAGVPVGMLSGRNKSWQDENKESKLWDFDVAKMFQKAGEQAQQLLVGGNSVLWFAIMRGALQEVLVDMLPKNKGVEMFFDKTLCGIQGSDGGAVLEFSDGSKSSFDLVVGCDGIKSAAKEYIEKGKVSQDPSKREGTAAALYSGIRIGYAVTDGDESEKNNRNPRTIKQVFADGAYMFKGSFGNGKNRPPCNCVFITSLDNNFNGPFKRKEAAASAISENADWSQDIQKPKQESRERMIQQLSSNRIPGDDVAAIIAESDRFFELGVYFHNPLSFSGWSKSVPSTEGSFVVLCGDSAHAMPPFLGQGVNQAVQDAYTLAEKVLQFNQALNTETPKDLRELLKEYEKTRWFPTTSITAKAAILGYLETGGRDGFYAWFRDLFFNILVLIGVPQRVLIDAATPKT